MDTRVFLWAAAEPGRLSDTARAVIEDPANELFLSTAAVWEIAIKYALGKLALPAIPGVYVPARADAFGLRDLPLRREHAFALASLPELHRDPFDRMMIAQAQVEALCLITADPSIFKYEVETIDARR